MSDYNDFDQLNDTHTSLHQGAAATPDSPAAAPVGTRVITVDEIMAWGPCGDYPRERVLDLIGDGKTPLEILDMDIPVQDRFWLLFREAIIPARELRLIAADFAEAVLPIYEAKYPNDKRLRKAIKAARQYARGEIDAAAYAAACDAARDAARDASRAAARAAARNAAYAAACDAACDAASAAASAASRAAACDAASAAARAAARDAARDAAYAAACDTACDAAYAAACDTEIVRGYLLQIFPNEDL